MSNNIAKMRQKKGLSQGEMAKILNQSRQNINYIENLRNKPIQERYRKNILAISNLLDCSPVILLGKDNFVFYPKTQEEKDYLIRLLNGEEE